MRARRPLTPRRAAPLAFAAGLVAALGAGPAQAQSCTVTAEPVLFDPYDPIGAASSDGVGAVRIRCDGPAQVTVGLGSGSGGAVRAMSSGADLLRYGLYADPSRLVPWGDGSTAPTRGASGPEADLAVYGRIPAGQNVPAGAYSDVVTVLLSF